jgi:hypothetical protein
MGSRDFRKKETKKPKKGAKKPPVIDITPAPQVEVLKVKGKKENPFPDEE